MAGGWAREGGVRVRVRIRVRVRGGGGEIQCLLCEIPKSEV